MSIEAIGGISPAGLLGALAPTSGVAGATGLTGATGVAGSGAAFGTTLAGSIDSLQAMQSTSKALGVAAVTGDLDDVHDYTIASTQASVALELTAALRNKAVEAFTEVMRMQA
ncbi:flagellar hook-basal body complex protein FliE [Actinotalea ferrariae]|uniref:flagellar hook-basal body complex protein FliE n=1 Tax=Actinotalea ferrariae TaxID=1386098 RepID=UPI001C8B3C97|nr:flagellar hook-basal body complex protein FliE [Actinotalea ferrariae]MBX9246629.1 flagellar hook-basal body complex protein FliE [Actinotalea ferrariae]